MKNGIKPLVQKIYTTAAGISLAAVFSFCTVTVFAQTVSYEAESGTLSNGAQISGCSECSGAQLVGWLGGTSNGTLTINVHVATAGKYVLKVFYASGDPRTIYVTANNGTGAALLCVPSGDWSRVGVAAITVDLNAGSNTLKFDNPVDWAPNLDRFSLSPAGNAVNIGFGSNNKIAYDTANGIWHVFYNNNKIIADAYALVYNGIAPLNSLGYASRVVSHAFVSDNFGFGTRYTVTLTGNGLPQMQQLFYVYPGKNYFYTELRVNGVHVSSNYMAPLISNRVNIQHTGDCRSLFVPFDNDAFISYYAQPLTNTMNNNSAEVTALYENNSRAGLIAGSVEHDVWKTGLRTSGSSTALASLAVWGGYADGGITHDQKPHGAISGTSIKSPKILVGYFDDWRKGLEEYGKANALATPRYVYNWTKPVPFGWNSWGEIKTNINLAKAEAVADFFANQIPAFRSGDSAFIDLDSYWDNLTPGGWTGDFSQLTQFVSYCTSKGLKAGIYWAPFVDWGKYERQLEGSLYNYQDTWLKSNGNYNDIDGARAMDPTHPGTKERIAYLIGKFKACGFKMIKIDFLGHAAVEADSYYDTTVTTGMQAYKKGMQYLVDQIGSQMIVYAAISPSLATGPYAHMRRIACDAESSIGSSAYTLNSTNYGWWQSYMYNYIDPDLLVFRNETEGTNRARFASGIVTGTLITGDDFSAPSASLTDRAQRILQNQALLSISRKGNGKPFQPVEGNTGAQPGDVYVKTIGDSCYVAVFNFTNDSKTYNIPLSRLGLGGHYTATELFSNTLVDVNESLSISLPASDAAIYRLYVGAPCVTPGKKGWLTDSVLLYPNPAAQYVVVQCSAEITRIRLLNSNGVVLSATGNIKSNYCRLDLARYPAGLYIVELTDRLGRVQTHKLVKAAL